MRRPSLLDGGWATTAQAEHAVRESAAALGLRLVIACTHFVREGPAGPRVVVTATADGPVPSDPVELDVVAAHESRSSGRAFVFPGSDLLTGVLTVAEMISGSGVDDVMVIGGGAADPATSLDTQGFVRPRFLAGRLVLHTRPAAGGRLVPFEQANPMPCCADHA